MKSHLTQITYTPQSPLRRPRKFLTAMLKDLSASRELAWRLLIRNINARYRQTALGYVWAFLPPVFTTLLFVYLNSQKIFSIGETTIPYPAYVMIGTLLWQVFADAMMSPLHIVKQSKPFLAKINFPRESLILTGIGEVLFNFMIRAVLLVAVLVYYRIPVSVSLLVAPIGILSLLLLGLMVGLFVVPLALLYQDVDKAMPLITTLWLFLTPVVYPPPAAWPASLIVAYNPVSPLLVTSRELITAQTITMLPAFLTISVSALLFIVIAWILYRIALPHVIVRMAA